jgi:hypothetical protein
VEASDRRRTGKNSKKILKKLFVFNEKSEKQNKNAVLIPLTLSSWPPDAYTELLHKCKAW